MHVPVLTDEILAHLKLKAGDNVIDATLDGGGHAKLFLEEIKPNGKVFGIEQDIGMINQLKLENIKNLIIIKGNFRNISQILRENNFHPKAVFFDLGMSTWHLKESGRGFSFQKLNEPLDMRFSDDAKFSAAQVINSFPEKEIAKIFKEYGEERKAFFWASRIVAKRKKKKILTVSDLLEVIDTKQPKILAKIFQSLRVFINDELGALSNGLSGAMEILPGGGKIAVLAYHSLEDRIVKNFFKNLNKNGLGKTFKKPITPSLEEIKNNPSARSAKLRIFEKI